MTFYKCLLTKINFLKQSYVCFLQQGILSRVTESVKNIVPGWLQRYFNKNENACSCSTGAGEVPHWPEDREDERVIYAGEDNTNSDDGRITPEPAGSNTEGKQSMDIW